MKNLTYLLVLLSVAFFYSCSEDSVLEEVTQNGQFEIPVLHNSRSCGHEEHMDNLLSDPDYKAAYNKRMQNHKSFVENFLDSRASCSSPVTVPVAVHYQGANGAATLACLTTMAQEQIDALNADYQGTNSDITNWTGNAASSFPGISHGEACLEFVLADQNHPSGFGLANGDLAVTRNATTGDFDSNWSGYLNIFVKDANGSLGYSPLGGAGNGDGVVIDLGAWGITTSCGNVGASAPFNLGRTLTHEIGHYLNLDHIWGNGCNQDDGISDTPNSQSDYFGCPNIGASSCGSTDLHMNYMDYTDDACMYMFSAGQITENESYVASSLTILTNNVSSVISGNSGGSGGSGGTGGTGSGGGAATCGIPATTSVANITTTTADVSWESQPEATKYQVRYRQIGTTSWSHKIALVNNKELTSLAPSTQYEYLIRTRCPSGWTGFSTTDTFTTAGNGGGSGGSTTCDAPGFSNTEYLTATRTKVTWEAMPQATRYQIVYRLAIGGAWSNSIVTTTSATLTGLTNGETYEYKIRTRCPSGWTGFSGLETFTQSSGGGGGGGGGNSTDNTIHFNLTLDNYGSETTWELLDSNDNIVTSGGPFTDGASGALISETFMIPDGCYTIFVDDSYGDGICCAYGNGSFEILDINNNQVGFSNGEFGNYDFIEFCVTDNVATFSDEQKDEKEINLEPKGEMVRF